MNFALAAYHRTRANSSEYNLYLASPDKYKVKGKAGTH